MSQSLGFSKFIAVLLLGAAAMAIPAVVSSQLVPRKPSALPHMTEDAYGESASVGEPQSSTKDGEVGSEPVMPATGSPTTLSAVTDSSVGERIAKKCTACHTVDKGGVNKVGPNLWDIVDRKPASVPGFGYSEALKGRTEIWSFEALNEFLAAPAQYLPGTKMAFPGIKQVDERAALLAYLGTLTEPSKPLPEAIQAAAQAGSAGSAEVQPEPPAAAGNESDVAAHGAALPSATGDGTPSTPSVAAPNILVAAPTAQTLAGWLSIADLNLGEKITRQCAICHSFEERGGTKIGPNLWDIVGAKQATKTNFEYSDAFGKLNGDWSFEELDRFLAAPQDYAPGTKMTFPGLRRPADRAAVIGWLRERSRAPRALPAVSAEEAADIAAARTAAPAVAAAEAPLTTTTEPALSEAAAQTPAAAGNETASAGDPQQAAVPPAGNLPDLLRTADASAGEKIAKKCAACHSFDKGGQAKVGPNLWDIVGSQQARAEGFKYSDALKSLGGEWTYEALDKFLTAPKEYATGTKMSFPGLKSAEERTAVIAWLRTLSDSPRPLP